MMLFDMYIKRAKEREREKEKEQREKNSATQTLRFTAKINKLLT